MTHAIEGRIPNCIKVSESIQLISIPGKLYYPLKHKINPNWFQNDLMHQKIFQSFQVKFFLFKTSLNLKYINSASNITYICTVQGVPIRITPCFKLEVFWNHLDVGFLVTTDTLLLLLKMPRKIVLNYLYLLEWPW